MCGQSWNINGYQQLCLTDMCHLWTNQMTNIRSNMSLHRWNQKYRLYYIFLCPIQDKRPSNNSIFDTMVQHVINLRPLYVDLCFWNIIYHDIICLNECAMERLDATRHNEGIQYRTNILSTQNFC